MSLLKRFFAVAKPAFHTASPSQPASQFPASAPQSQSPMAELNASRRDLLRLALRDTLNRTGIPTSWIGADMMAATSRGREPGIHVRLLLKHWDPRLMLHGVGFQNTFMKRVLTLDADGDQWLLGISWQFSLPDNSIPPPMPHPGVWTSSVPSPSFMDPGAAAALTGSDPTDILGGSIVISGPAATPDSSAARPAAAAAIGTRPRVADARAEAKADLERLFAVRDQDMKRHAPAGAGAAPGFASTQPAGIEELPAEPRHVASDAAQRQQSFAKTDVFRRPERPGPPSGR